MNVPRKTLIGSVSACTKLALMTAASLALMVAISSQWPAGAAEKSTIVSIADLDLSTEKGMQAARERVHEAARHLCKKVVDPWSLSHQPDYVQCVDETTADAVTKLQRRQLLANVNTNALGRSYP
jgi:UrcA family protein